MSLAKEFEKAPVGLKVRRLTVTYPIARGNLPALKDVSLTIEPGTITGVIGESGSGKTTLMMALMHAIRPPGRIESGEVWADGVGNVLELSGEALRRVHGPYFGFVFQASSNSLNPLKKVGTQILDLARSHGRKDGGDLLRRAKDLAERMGMDGERVLTAYQHELSGGMRQRVNILMALVLKPRVLILDEPTTALDMLSQQSVLQIVKDIQEEEGLTTLIVTHDMGVVAELAHRIAVLYAGQVVEEGPSAAVLRHPQHPYTEGLIRAIPRITGPIEEARPLAGNPPDLASIRQVGCVFWDRCPVSLPQCEEISPQPVSAHQGGMVTCHRWTV